MVISYLKLQWSPEQIASHVSVSLHECVADKLDIDWYFADPYSAWQRGTNENTNGLIRQYIRKGSDLNNYSDEYVLEITQRLNQRPRKRLGFKSPSQVLWQQHGVALQMLI
jgi:IS30 family transposase